ncbi:MULTISPECIES: glycerophosphodiester phosphodiesterase [unclassified Corynebacterium]|uniref:glycerophosphodiester phosphodiesterase n=1 Tax=unclassified Corynebacterium TaxID=2624378 RepID=UPI0030A2B3F3
MQIVAHRGASGTFPEHTLAAYEEAVRQGADGVECDLRLSGDGHLVCFHDRLLDRTTNGRGPIGAMPISKLRTLNAGTEEAPQPILEFETFLEFVSAHPDLGVFIETKHPVMTGLRTERKLREQLKHFGLDTAERTHVISFSTRSMSAVGTMLPKLNRIQLVDSPSPRTALRRYLGRPTSMGVDIVGARRDPTGATGWKKPLYSWLAKTDTDVTFAHARGVQWLATDWPAEARAVLDTARLEQSAPGAEAKRKRADAGAFVPRNVPQRLGHGAGLNAPK